MLWIRYCILIGQKWWILIGRFKELGKLDDLDTLGSYIYDLDETHLEINRKRFQIKKGRKWTINGPEVDRIWTGNENIKRQGIEFRQPETDFHVNVKYQEIFGITMSHRAKAGFPLVDWSTF